MNCLFVEQLTVIDCAYLDVGRGLVGESWIVDVELHGDLDEQSMVLDFGDVKKRLKRAIDGSVDHTLLVPKLAPGLTIEHRDGEIELQFQSGPGLIEHRSPLVAVSLVEAESIGAQAVTDYLLPHLKAVVPANVAEIRLSLRTERIDGAYYHYVHGLKKHQGQCQRIAHGHRSRIEIRVDGIRSQSLEAALAARWTDIYLATREDVIGAANGRLRFAYRSPEGRFELCLPENRVELIDSDTTVEKLAEWIANRTSGNVEGGQTVQVKAYEGVMKGAIASRKNGES
jgi:6-pyruvoyl-tetrahydropterin synthase